MDKKTAKPLAWSHKATPEAARAMKQLRRVRAQQALLAEQSKQLQEVIIKDGGGMAHGMRAAIHHQSGGQRWRMVTIKARDNVVLLEAASGKRITADSQR
jgi:hypothetical protein